MKLEIIDSKLVLTPVTRVEEKEIYAIAAAWSAYQAVRFPDGGEQMKPHPQPGTLIRAERMPLTASEVAAMKL